jgi:hypothetical protein
LSGDIEGGPLCCIAKEQTTVKGDPPFLKKLRITPHFFPDCPPVLIKRNPYFYGAYQPVNQLPEYWFACFSPIA